MSMISAVLKRLAWLAAYVLGLVALVLVLTAAIFFVVGLFRIVGDLVFRLCDCAFAMEIVYAGVGGLFLLVAVLLWSKRTGKTVKDES